MWRQAWQSLRWRLVGAQMLVVFVGVVVLALSAQIALRSLPSQIEATLTTLVPAAGPQVIDQTTLAITQTMQQVVLQSLVIAAIAATVAGLFSSILLMREILRPLDDIVESSRRIADGHYDERVTVPTPEELALVATNFNEMAESLGQVEQQRVEMIGNVAHELRTPLTGLRGYLEGLLDGLFPGNNETFGHMYHEVRRLQRLIDDLQALSRVEAGQFDLSMQRFDLNSVIERVANQARPQIDAENLNLEIHLSAAPLSVFADADRAAQVLVNLLSNAIRYTPEGGSITVITTQEERFAQVQVCDSGRGIALEDQKHIFDRFYRADPSRTRSSGGSGIGLTIARHLIWAMGGRISVESPGVDQGSTFSVWLPLAGQQSAG